MNSLTRFSSLGPLPPSPIAFDSPAAISESLEGFLLALELQTLAVAVRCRCGAFFCG